MKFRVSSRAVVVVCLALSSVCAYAQTDGANGSNGATANTAPTRKEIRTRNHALEKAVRHALSKTKGLDSTGITIIARGGKITLTGSVLDASQIDMAGKTAASTAGVTSVDNRVSVREIGS